MDEQFTNSQPNSEGVNTSPVNSSPEQAMPVPDPVQPPVPSAPAPATGWNAPAFASSPPPQAPSIPSVSGNNDVAPAAVVQVLSTRGVEYTMLTLCLWLSAAALIWILLALFNGGASFSILAFPVALLVVSLPIFGALFMRLKKAELANPALKADPSKRKLTQFTQIIAFAVCLFNIIAFVYLLFSKMAGQSGPSLIKDFLNLVVVLVVAGGVLAYYWNDEHRG